MKVIDDFKKFWGRQSRNYKVFLARDILGRLFGGGGGEGGFKDYGNNYKLEFSLHQNGFYVVSRLLCISYIRIIRFI